MAIPFFVLLFWGLFFFIPRGSFGQSIHSGFKYRTNYSTGLHPQNWCIVQDRRGIIYAANNGGVLEFDGVSWRTIRVPNWVVRSLAVDDQGTVYVGGIDELGYLAPDAKGALQYISLLENVPDQQKKFSTVWRVNTAKDGVYFRAKRYLFRWQPSTRQMKVWQTQKTFDASFVCSGKLFIHQRGVGLMQMVGDDLQVVRGNESFASVEIYMMAPYGDRKILIGTRSKGFFVYDCPGMSSQPFPTGADDFLRKNELYYGIQLADGGFALATLQGGMAIIDTAGRLKGILTGETGLPADDIFHVYEDLQGSLWLAHGKGITQIEYNSPISVFDQDRSNLRGLVLSVVRHGPGKRLYVGTTYGLHVLEPTGPGPFRLISGATNNCWHLLSVGDSLLAATNNGVFQVGGNDEMAGKIISIPAYFLCRSKKDPNRIWVGTRQGLVLLSPAKNRWIEEKQFENIGDEIRSIVEDGEGNLWLGILTKGVISVALTGETIAPQAAVTHYGAAQGLPPGEIAVSLVAGRIVCTTKKGLFRFDKEKKIFVPDSCLGNRFADGSRNVFRIAEDNDKNLWFHSEFRNYGAARQADGTYTVSDRPFLRIPLSQVNAIYPDPGGDSVWFAGNDGLIRWDKTLKKDYRQKFPVLIRRVTVNGRPIFEGYRDPDIFPIIAYKDRNLRFEYAAPSFEAETETRYRCFLQGYDDGWTEWNPLDHKDYTNLDAGHYTFRVRARNVYGADSTEALFRFRVLPPWTKTWWAFLLYALAAFLSLFLVVKWRSRKLVHEKQRLEQIIRERTREIADKGRQLADQAEQLKEMDRVKSRFFANISHEFRTPLTLIMGPIEQILSGAVKGQPAQEKKLRLMLRNSQRLLNLINQLLDLSKLESGKMKLRASRQNIVPFLKGMLASFEVLATRQDLELTFFTEEDDISLYFDAEKLEEVLVNLLANAVKFTPAGGKITLAARIAKAQPGTDQEDSLEISVSDTGPGIPREQLAHIFDRFYQADSTYEHHWKGSGIGLALVKELVELHHGTIEVHNRQGEQTGCEFIVHLPQEKNRFLPGEIVDGAVAIDRTAIPRDIPGFTLEEGEDDGGISAGDSGTGDKDIILVVEDSPDMREFIRGALSPLYTVVEAGDGSQGLEKARQTIPDLIISDIMMPGIDGYELCKTLKQDVGTSHIPIILLTAKADQDNVLAGLETGADDYITKPFSTRILLARIKNLIDLRRIMQQNIQRRLTLQPAKVSIAKIDEDFLDELQKAIDKNLSDPDFNVDALCGRLYLSRATLWRKIHALTGESPTDFIRSVRLKRGAELLEQDFGTVTDVAFEVGFSSAAYFTKCFKEKFQQLPSSFLSSKAGYLNGEHN